MTRAICRRQAVGAILLLVGLSVVRSGSAQEVGACARCGWSAPRSSATTTVRTMAELRLAVNRAGPRSTILLEDGVYHLAGVTLEIKVRGLVLRGNKGKESRVLIWGRGMGERMVAVMVSAPEVTLADLTIGQVGHHGIQVRGELGADRVTIHHVHIIDTGQQLIKGSGAPGLKPCRDGLVACSTLEYTDSAPSDYTNGVDVHNGENWVVRDNVLRRIRGPLSQGYRAGPAILFWSGSRDTIVERNWLVDCYRGIALGLMRDRPKAPGGLDHRGGIVRRNAICNLDIRADEPIEINASPGALVEHNTVMVEGKVPWSISIRFPTASAVVRNNLTRHQIALRDGGKAERVANITDARPEWFVDASRGDVRLARGDVPAVDAGVVISDGKPAIDSKKTYLGSAPDAGAFEYHASPP